MIRVRSLSKVERDALVAKVGEVFPHHTTKELLKMFDVSESTIKSWKVMYGWAKTEEAKQKEKAQRSQNAKDMCKVYNRHKETIERRQATRKVRRKLDRMRLLQGEQPKYAYHYKTMSGAKLQACRRLRKRGYKQINDYLFLYTKDTRRTNNPNRPNEGETHYSERFRITFHKGYTTTLGTLRNRYTRCQTTSQIL